MMHPWLKLVSTQPQLLVDHAEAYAELVAEEVSAVLLAWKRRTLLYTVALCFLCVAAVHAGVALMLWAVMPVIDPPGLWVLIAAPLLPIAVAAGCLLAARAPRGAGRAFDNVRSQFKADQAMLRELSAS